MSLVRALLRSFAFLRKEISESLRHPQIFVTVILGPFLILLLFGVGFIQEPPSFRTAFVTEGDQEMSNLLLENAGNISPQVEMHSTTEKLDQAILQLKNEQVDLVILLPRKPMETIRQDRQAVFTLYHHELDPAMANYMQYFGRVYVNEINRRALEQAAQAGQQDAAELQPTLTEARESASALRQALETGDIATAVMQRARLEQHLDRLALVAGASNSSVAPPAVGSEGDSQGSVASIVRAQETAQGMAFGVESDQERDEQIAEVEEIEQDLTLAEERLDEIRTTQPDVLVSPFRSETKNLAPSSISPSDFLAPAVVVLLLQHLAVTFSAMAIIRERIGGSFELLRVSPASPFELLLGKSLGYLLMTGLIAAALTLLAVHGLAVPLSGRIDQYALILLLLLLPSLGYGFVFSILASNETLAVQFSMLMLLTTVVFGGFLIPLEDFSPAIRSVAWILPATHAIPMLRDVMLLGGLPPTLDLAILGLLGLITLAGAWLLLGRLMRNS